MTMMQTPEADKRVIVQLSNYCQIDIEEIVGFVITCSDKFIMTPGEPPEGRGGTEQTKTAH
jgi:hypothetical protein